MSAQYRHNVCTISLEIYVRTTSHEGYMTFSRWPRTHAIRVTGHKAKGSQSGGFPPPAPPHRPQPFFAPVSCSNSYCVCVWPPWKRHISLARHISLVKCCADIVQTYISRDMSALYPSSVFSSAAEKFDLHTHSRSPSSLKSIYGPKGCLHGGFLAHLSCFSMIYDECICYNIVK